MAEVLVSEGQIQQIQSAIHTVSGQVAVVGNYVNQVDAEVKQLQKNFEEMIKEQRQRAAFQKAITEIVRIRQEIEDKFGNHKQIRENMLGILQATDAALVTQTTISRCSEELMLNAPKYWLAPCLIAVAAWIADNESLAKRALVEAVKRDREKTCLLFALICRRNGRTDACFRWLAKYLEEQDPNKMTKSVVAFIDAYTNGVFGEDRDNVCGEYISNWLEILKKANPEFDNEQKTFWKNFFNIKGEEAKYKSAEYNILKSMSPDFPKIDAFVSRITSVHSDGGVKEQLTKIQNAPVNMQQLIDDVDEELRKLVTNYEEGEETELRNEETYLQLVKEYKGNEVLAQRRMELIKAKRRDDPIDFAQRLRTTIANPSEKVSARKSALFIVKQYVIDAYADYIVENKDVYPEEITLKLAANPENRGQVTWAAKTKEGENLADMKKQVSAKFDEVKETAVLKAKPHILAVIFTFGYASYKYKKKTKPHIEQIYDQEKNAANVRIEKAVAARIYANNLVNEFLAKDNWNTLEF